MTTFTLTTNGIAPIRQPVPKKFLSDLDGRIRGQGTSEPHRAAHQGTEPAMSTITGPDHSCRPGPAPSAVEGRLAASTVAAIATTTLAAIASAAGVSFADHSGDSIPIADSPR